MSSWSFFDLYDILFEFLKWFSNSNFLVWTVKKCLKQVNRLLFEYAWHNSIVFPRYLVFYICNSPATPELMVGRSVIYSLYSGLCKCSCTHNAWFNGHIKVKRDARVYFRKGLQFCMVNRRVWSYVSSFCNNVIVSCNYAPYWYLFGVKRQFSLF